MVVAEIQITLVEVVPTVTRIVRVPVGMRLDRVHKVLQVAMGREDTRGVTQVVSKPDWKSHGKAAPFKRNDKMLETMPQGLIATPGSGITENIVDKARKLGIRIKRIGA